MATSESIDLNYTLQNTTVEEHNVTVKISTYNNSSDSY
jgi:hypothetical protein